MSKISLETNSHVSWLVHSIKGLDRCKTRPELKLRLKEVERNFLVLKKNLFGRKKA